MSFRRSTLPPGAPPLRGQDMRRGTHAVQCSRDTTDKFLSRNEAAQRPSGRCPEIASLLAMTQAEQLRILFVSDRE
jgi:hypothetical protein